MEGVFLSVIAEALGRKLRGRRCAGAQLVLGDTLSLSFGQELLLLCARPGSPSVELKAGGRHESLPPAAVWNDHLEGAVLESVEQRGLDRVLDLTFTPSSPYSSSGSLVVFEAAGRNANLMLVRSADGRILACLRTVTSRQSRYRRVAPGEPYVPPPPSGEPPGRWTDPSVRDALLAASRPRDVYALLEGVGPSTAAALLEESRLTGRPLPDVVEDLAETLVAKRFEPWKGAWGPLPMRLGAGESIEDPLAPACPDPSGPGARDSMLAGFEAKMEVRISECRKRVERIRKALEDSVAPSVYRNWGSLLLARARDVAPGSTEVLVAGWEGEEVRIPLRPRRTWQGNADRYFRKARNAEVELSNLRHLLKAEEQRIESLAEALERARETGVVEPALAPKPGRPGAGKTGPMERLVAPGWRCWVGRNAKENDTVTFRMGRRGDVWLHARGLSGAHVILRCEGKQESPPAAVLEQAAALAARNSKSTSEVIPVDYTLVQHVRKARGAGPGEVLYTGEKTLFIRMTPVRGARLRKGERKEAP